ncbi:uncharacterized protein BO80DRAFT_422299 [Aspergillus ibericus CBS 121593]|uniref:Uncharacterized protein n=1 Tax=Aspergillus ibericus CBS 121593 TaxID=1448316 RepID=A0A395HE11_9EURO|nr:hypothetical protein BO80DRAFT_422299 [Aspergillus ibericus CBS 121593]RAL04464.1 hypothetical protein BO80DRAFT_422299 [Aspergillus ibericus CBS 121593]
MSAAVKQLAVGSLRVDCCPARGCEQIFQASRKAILLAGCDTSLATMAEIREGLRLLWQWFDGGLMRVPDKGLSVYPGTIGGGQLRKGTRLLGKEW